MGKKVSKKITTNLLKALNVATVEKDVEVAYRAALEELFPGCISSPNGCDGVLRDTNITSLLEFKYDLDLRNPLERSSVIVQSLYYLKKMIDRGESLVKVVFIGDVNECFCIPTKDLTKYFSYDVNWSIAPSAAPMVNLDLVLELSKDESIRPFVYDIDEKFDFQAVIEKMENISLDRDYALSITAGNIVPIFRVFEKDVVKDRRFKKDSDNRKISDLVDLFFTCLTSPDDAYLHPKKENIVVVKGKEIKVNSSNYRAFFSHFRQEYRPSELEELTANKDRILEDTLRRRTGAFFTPQIWADEAHKMIAEQFGENWKDEYVVWDCAAGTANLTRGYKFKELYISTLDQSDVDTIKDCGYNPEATVFQYDFLSEIGSKNDILTPTGIEGVPDSLKEAFKSGKKILFFINPPFGKSVGIGCPKNAGKNIVNTTMLENSVGKCSSQLYAQFMYKILSFAKRYSSQISVALFSQSNFMVGPSYRKFWKKWEEGFQFLGGMLFDAGNFIDVSSGWEIGFTTWGPEKTEHSDKKILLLKKINDSYEIEIIGTKEVYAADKNKGPCNKWIREETKDKKFPEVIGYFNNGANNIASNNRNVRLYGKKSSEICFWGEEKHKQLPHPIPIISTNFRKVVALFAARKIIKLSWYNGSDEYTVPNTSHPNYKQWNNDAIVYSLFETTSRQSSFRNVCYENECYNTENEFFFMSNKEMRKLADNNNFNAMYQDAKTFNQDRYIYKLFPDISLSVDALQVLNLAKQLVRKSMKMRKAYHEANPKYHLNAWDAGWAQLKPMLKKYYKEDYDEFVTVYKKFEDRMREGVYKFGFLRR